MRLGGREQSGRCVQEKRVGLVGVVSLLPRITEPRHGVGPKSAGL